MGYLGWHAFAEERREKMARLRHICGMIRNPRVAKAFAIWGLALQDGGPKKEEEFDFCPVM